MSESIEQYERKQDRLEAESDQREREAEDHYWDKLTKEGRIKGPDW